MRLADVVAGLQVEWVTEIALLLLAASLAMVVVSILGRRHQADFERAAALPLEDETTEGASRG